MEVINIHVPNGTGPKISTVLGVTFEGQLIGIVKPDRYR